MNRSTKDTEGLAQSDPAHCILCAFMGTIGNGSDMDQLAKWKQNLLPDKEVKGWNIKQKR